MFGSLNINGTTDVICNYISNVLDANSIWGSSSSTSIDESISLSTTIRIRINKSRLTDWDDELTSAEKVTIFQEFLKSLYESGNPMIIYYKLAEEYSLDFTDEQKEALEELENVTSYADTTNIFSTDELSPIFTAEAYANTSTLISNLQSAVSSLTETEEE